MWGRCGIGVAPVGQQAGGTEVHYKRLRAGLLIIASGLAGCQYGAGLPPPPPASALPASEYLIGPGDMLNIFVWRNPELSVEAPVRPDGLISIPLAEDVPAVGQTATVLAREIEKRLAKYVTDPVVTVIPKTFVGPFEKQVRVVGEAVTPRALPFRANMTVLDAIIQVGGLTKFAAGNRATLVRTVNQVAETYPVHLQSLINDGDIASNVALAPGDIIIIPQTYF